MNKEEAKVLLPIIKAFTEGKIIEYRNRDLWLVATSPSWSRDVKYRIRPAWADLSPGDPVLVKMDTDSIYQIRVFKGVSMGNTPFTYNTESSSSSWDYCKPFKLIQYEYKLQTLCISARR